MKIKAIVSVTASAIALCAVGQVSAHTGPYFEPYNTAEINSATYKIYLGGATAQDQGIVLLMRRLCTVGTMTRIVGNKQTAILCHANGTDSAPIAAGTHLVLYKNSNGGSGTGVKPVADQTALPFLNLTNWTTAALYTANCTLGGEAATPDFSDFKEYNCGTNISTANVVPNAGISDVEPDLLGWVSGVNGPLTVVPGPQLLFGVPVSKNFRDALQTAQGKPVGSNSEADMPSLTKDQIASIYNGGINTSSRLSGITGTVMPGPSTPSPFQICRRKGDTPATPGGSGTLASYRAFFLNVPCSQPKLTKDIQGQALPTTEDGDLVAPALPATKVIQYSGTVGVLGCLGKQHDAGKYAIGMASMENVPGFAYGIPTPDPKWGVDLGKWGWVKIQGYAPTLLNTVQSKYDFAMELTYQYRTLTVPQKAFFDKLVSTNSSKVVIVELNKKFIQNPGPASWQSGLLGVPSAGTATKPSDLPLGVLTAPAVTDNPINTWTRAATGAPNSCQPPYVTGETGLDMLM